MALVEIGICLAIVWFVCKWYFQWQTIGNYNGRHVLITGCDTGFGNELVKRLDTLGFYVFAGCLTEKGENELQKCCSDKLSVFSLDVTKIKSIEEGFWFVDSKLPPNKGLWGLVNNAGIAGPVGPVEWFSRSDYDRSLDVNLFGMTEVTRIFTPLIKQEKGRIVNITSILGRIAISPAPYVVSKYAAEGYSDCLRRNLYKTGVTVHIIEPGYFKTNINKPETISRSFRNQYAKLDDELKKYYGEEYVESTAVFLEKFLESRSAATHKVVDAYEHALCSCSPKHRYVVGLDANILFRIFWSLPEWMSDFILCYNSLTPHGAQKT